MEKAGPGSIWVCYVSRNAPGSSESIKGKVVGFYQLGSEIGDSSLFIEPSTYALYPGRWSNAIRADAAWTIDEADWKDVWEFAPESYYTDAGTDRGQSIGQHGRRLTASEARGLLSMRAKQVAVYGGTGVDLPDGPAVPVGELPAPSRPGPAVEGKCLVDRTRNTAKALYVLHLYGDTQAFFGSGFNVGDRSIYKIGLSHSPTARCAAFNAALPIGQFKWHIARSTELDGHPHYPDQASAQAGEQAMIGWLQDQSNDVAMSRGGEFFLASDAAIAKAWAVGREAALAYPSSRT